jgi:hypothetical protein
MAISPRFAEDGILFIGIRGREEGIFKTIDGGDTFKKLDLGLPISGNIKLAISPDYAADQTIFAGTGNGLIVSRNGGKSWQISGSTYFPPKGNILSVAVSPNYKQDRTILLAVKGSGIFKSVDSAKSFSRVGTQLQDQNEQLKQLVFSKKYQNDNMIFGVSDENVFISRDGGITWKLIKRPIRYEDVQDTIIYEGHWEKLKGGDYSDSTQTRSNTPGSKVTLRFVGSNLRLIGEKAPENGIANVFLDGELHKEISFHSMERAPAQVVYSLSIAQKGVHEITVEVAEANKSTGWVAIDAFEIFP